MTSILACWKVTMVRCLMVPSGNTAIICLKVSHLIEITHHHNHIIIIIIIIKVLNEQIHSYCLIRASEQKYSAKFCGSILVPWFLYITYSNFCRSWGTKNVTFSFNQLNTFSFRNSLYFIKLAICLPLRAIRVVEFWN